MTQLLFTRIMKIPNFPRPLPKMYWTQTSQGHPSFPQFSKTVHTLQVHTSSCQRDACWHAVVLMLNPNTAPAHRAFDRIKTSGPPTLTLQFLRMKSRHGSTSHSNMVLVSSLHSSPYTSGKTCSQDLTSGRQPSVIGSRYTMPQRLTVAGCKQRWVTARLQSWFFSADDDDDELMLNVLRCHETY